MVTLCINALLHESFSVKCGWSRVQGSVMLHSTVDGVGYMERLQ